MGTGSLGEQIDFSWRFWILDKVITRALGMGVLLMGFLYFLIVDTLSLLHWLGGYMLIHFLFGQRQSYRTPAAFEHASTHLSV